jgi:hypothetical protein
MCIAYFRHIFIMSFEVSKSAKSTIFVVVPEAGLEPARYR